MSKRVKIRKDKHGYHVNNIGKTYTFDTLKEIKEFIANGYKHTITKVERPKDETTQDTNRSGEGQPQIQGSELRETLGEDNTSDRGDDRESSIEERQEDTIPSDNVRSN